MNSKGVQRNTCGWNAGGDKASRARINARRGGVQERDRAALQGSSPEPGEPDRLLLRTRGADAGVRVRLQRNTQRELAR